MTIIDIELRRDRRCTHPDCPRPAHTSEPDGTVWCDLHYPLRGRALVEALEDHR